MATGESKTTDFCGPIRLGPVSWHRRSDQDVAAGGNRDEAIDAQIRAHQVRQLVGYSPVIAAGNLANSGLTALLLWEVVPHGLLLAWVAAIWLAAGQSLRTWWRNRATEPRPRVSRRVTRRAAIWAVLVGILWGAAAVVFYPYLSQSLQLVLVFVIGGMGAAAVASLSAFAAASIGFIVPALAPLIGRLALTVDSFSTIFAAMLAFYAAALIFFARIGEKSFTDNIRVKLEKANLLAEVERSRSMLGEVVDGISEGFAIYDPEGRITLCNRRFRELHGGGADAIESGARIDRFLAGSSVSGRDGEAACSDNHRCGDNATTARESDGSTEQQLGDGRWLLLRQQQMSGGNRVGIWMDITALKNREQALKRARDAAEEGSRTKSRFLAMMSHELRTPLNAIIGFSDVIENQMMGPIGSERYTDYARDIRLSGEHLLAIISDILDLAKAEAGKLELREEAVDLAQALSALRTRVFDPATGAQPEYIQDIPPALPMLWGDPRKLSQIVVNLLTNACQYTPDGGTITLSARRAGDGGIEVEVSDAGVGIAPDDIEIALSPFGQTRGQAEEASPGIGLGLPLSKCLTELHGGTLTLISTPGEGTTVTVRLPKERVLDDGNAEVPAAG